jgi:hypothetical protein
MVGAIRSISSISYTLVFGQHDHQLIGTVFLLVLQVAFGAHSDHEHVRETVCHGRGKVGETASEPLVQKNVSFGIYQG